MLQLEAANDTDTSPRALLINLFKRYKLKMAICYMLLRKKIGKNRVEIS